MNVRYPSPSGLRVLRQPTSKPVGGLPVGNSDVSGTSATTNANDTSSASGTVPSVGTSATTNANDTSSASGKTTILGTSATTNANDTSAASGKTTILGTSATTNANDTSSASGTTTIVGTSATTNADDASSASGTVGGGSVDGTSATTNADDASDASGTVTPPVLDIPQGGAGHPTVYWGVKKHKKWKRNLDWLLDRVVSDYYGELTQPTVPIQVRKEAKQIVKPYIEQKQVNWAKFEGDLDRVIKLLELYQHLQDIEDDDETWLMMH